MLTYKVKMPTGHIGNYKVKMPTGHLGNYKVKMPVSETITIRMDGAPAGASWTLRDSVGIVATGSTPQAATKYPEETYTLTWEDTAFGWIPPAAEGPEVLSYLNPITFGPP
jgi:hypothetical protein